MEEDIKILEEFINQLNRKGSLLFFLEDSKKQATNAIENLIQRNKELEKYVLKPDCAEPVEKTEEMVNMNYVKHNYIPKSKIKKYIDKIQKELNKYKVKGMYIAIEGDTTQDNINTWLIQRATLQELLED